MLRSFKLPRPATVIACIALLVSLGGTGYAAGVPLAKKALFANNAGKLQGKTAAKVAAMPGPATSLNGKTAAEIAATPGPATTLNGKTADEIAATPGPATTLNGKSADEIAAMPGPASTAAGLVSIVSQPFSLAAGAEGDHSASCPPGTRVLSGGYAPTGSPFLLGAASRPVSETTWTIYLVNLDDSAISGNVYAVCLK